MVSSNSAANSMKLNFLEEAVFDALVALDDVKREVIKHRFGLLGEACMSYHDLALYLSSTLSPELRLQIATQVTDRDEAEISEEDIKRIESEGLRELARRCKKPRPLPS
jgi:hypothetical protein